ncbi:hypothetical protein QE422_003019 [Chryseobacterium sp. SORGH_AS 447]|uniref:lipocalin family protein n=1 Tax=Chryseobacterium sp. SORGH_AS_0447 TaxID=3041769 RepID=UPI0027833EF4|nr:lipocalin family protein [Chryseobacterium sp. SORGH_AS_0447]MDQ1162651.1 hypothetical protein [Chryseobacterium sp. SORGH_AS_0447]
MKKLLFLAVSAGFIFTSCNNNDDEDPNSIVGTWRPVSEKAISGKNGNTLYNDPHSTCYKKSTFNFKSNNTLSSTIYDENSNGNCENFGTETSPYSFNAGNMQLTVDGDTSEVLVLNSKELHVVSDYDDVNGDGVDDKIILVLAR